MRKTGSHGFYRSLPLHFSQTKALNHSIFKVYARSSFSPKDYTFNHLLSPGFPFLYFVLPSHHFSYFAISSSYYSPSKETHTAQESVLVTLPIHAGKRRTYGAKEMRNKARQAVLTRGYGWPKFLA